MGGCNLNLRLFRDCGVSIFSIEFMFTFITHINIRSIQTKEQDNWLKITIAEFFYLILAISDHTSGI